VVIAGPPGTGKTTLAGGLADQAARVLGETLLFVDIDPHAFPSQLLGESQRGVARLFERTVPDIARRGRPTVVLLATMTAESSRPPLEASGFEILGYTDVDERPPFKLALQVVDDRWYLYCGHLWHRGWSIIDVTDPTQPVPVAFVEGPDNTWTAQVNVAGGIMLTALARLPLQWGGLPDEPFEEAAIVWDVRDPTAPRELARLRFGGTGSHRNFWAGGRYAYLATNVEGYANYILVVIDLANPAQPLEVGRWWVPGQGPGDVPAPGDDGLSLHGPAYVVGSLAYVPYGGAGMIVLDVGDPAQPRLVSRFDVSPPFNGGLYGKGVHTALPFTRRGLAVVNGEAHEERCDEPLTFAGILDVGDPMAPRLLSMLPWPRPSAGLAYTSYCDKGGRFGPHNSHLGQGHPDLEDRDDMVYMTWFNAGLRVYDVRDPRSPIEMAHFVPADPIRRYGPLPATALVTQSEDVLVDRRGVVYLSDKNQGLYLLRLTGG
jgi:hypothetical protein